MNREKLILHPVRMRILQYLTLHKTATPTDLVHFLEDVSRATVYNHIKVLEENQIIEVIQRNPIRGTVEKVFHLKQDPPLLANEKNPESVFHYLLNMILDFETYFQTERNNSQQDMLFIEHSLLLMTDQEYQIFFQEYTQLIQKYTDHSMKDGRKMRAVSLISSPVIDIEPDTGVNKKAY